MDHIQEYYTTAYDEDTRLLVQHGQVEYLVTQKYIHDFLGSDKSKKIIEVGAGTGRYSVALAKEGYHVTAVDLTEHNLDILRSKLSGEEPIEVHQGTALDLSRFADESFDLTLFLGPLYHLYSREDKLQALREAVRITKKNGIIMVAYCMNDPSIVNYVFWQGHLTEDLVSRKLDPTWHAIIRPPEDHFELVRTEEIADLDAELPVTRLKLIGTDGFTNYMRDFVDQMDAYTFGKWVEYQLAICERQDLIGASHHTLDILQKAESKTVPFLGQ